MKSVSNTSHIQLTPSSKKLKQARLPFQVISPISTESQPGRKRKLSVQDEDRQPKIGKTTKENDTYQAGSEVLEISDDEEKDNAIVKTLNPYVKIVDMALKKKLKKSKFDKRPNANSTITSTDCGADSEKCLDIDLNSVNDQTNEILVVDKCAVMYNTNEKKGEQDLVAECDIIQSEACIIEYETKDGIINKFTNKSCDDGPKTDVNINSCNVTDEIPLDVGKKCINITESLQPTNEDNNDDSYKRGLDNETEKISSVEDTSSNKNFDITEDNNCSKDQKGSIEVENLDCSKVSDDSEAESEADSLIEHLDDSVTSSPKLKDNSLDERRLNSTANVNLTPKQLAKKVEFAKRREQREKEKLQRKKEREDQRTELAKLRLQREEMKRKEREEREEMKKKEREEKEEQRKREKEEKERLKEKEKRDREEREELKKKEKEEQKKREKEAKEEERKKRQEALDEERRLKDIEKQEAQNKKKKAAAAFVNFFVPKQKVDRDCDVVDKQHELLSNFAIKADMLLAPINRNRLHESAKKELEDCIHNQNDSKSRLYLEELRQGIVTAKTSSKTWPLEDTKDCIIVETDDELPACDVTSGQVIMPDMQPEKMKPKLFSFHENNRPPYWGTWRKKSSSIKGRRPFATDLKQLDYMCDSDEDWEEEPEGESLSGSVAGSDDDKNDLNDYDIDNDWMVPHGYLSDEEAAVEDDIMSMSPETQKLKLKYLEDKFENEMRKPTERLKPRLFGVIWETSNGEKPNSCTETLWQYMSKMNMMFGNIDTLLKPPIEPKKLTKLEKSEKPEKSRSDKIDKSKSDKQKSEITDKFKPEKSNEKKRVPILTSVPVGRNISPSVRNNLLTKFIKVAPPRISESEDKQSEPGKNDPKETNEVTISNKGNISSVAHVPLKEKKRVPLLASGPRGHVLIPAAGKSLITNFVKVESSKTSDGVNAGKLEEKMNKNNIMEVDECIVIND